MTTKIPASMVSTDVATAASVTSEANTRAAAVTGLTTSFSGHESRIATREAQVPTLGTPTATTSGTSKDYTNIPAWAKRVILLIDNVSLNGTANLLVQVGTAGGIVNTGYTGGVAQAGASPAQSTATAGLQLTSSSLAASTHVGKVEFVLANASTNKWIGTGILSRSDGYSEVSAAVVTLSGALDRIRLTTSNGTDTFDAGTVNVLYEA